MELKYINPFVRFSRVLSIRENTIFPEYCPIDARLFLLKTVRVR